MTLSIFLLGSLLWLGACAQKNVQGELSPGSLDSENAELNNPSNSGEITTPTPPNATPGDAPAATNNSATPLEILNNMAGAWSSTCRDMDSKLSNTSEKDVVIISMDPKGNMISIYTLRYSGSRSCEKSRFKEIEEHAFSLGSVVDGRSERNSALALDLVNSEMKIEDPQNVLLVFASPENSKLKGRILFEVLDSQRTLIRLQIQEWKDLLSERMKDQDAVVVQLESIQNGGNTKDRHIHYTKSQAFSRSSPEDLTLLNN